MQYEEQEEGDSQADRPFTQRSFWQNANPHVYPSSQHLATVMMLMRSAPLHLFHELENAVKLKVFKDVLNGFLFVFPQRE
jgi:hypothetical protein